VRWLLRFICSYAPLVTVLQTNKFLYNESMSPVTTSQVTHRTYTVCGQLNCSDTNVIYLITCSKCSAQYVGYTRQSLRYQIAQHIRAIESAKIQGPSTPLHDHYRDPLVLHSQIAFFLLCGGGEKGSGTMTIEILFRHSPVFGER